MEQPTVFNLLAASGPFTDYAEKLMLYGQFVGAWKIEVNWFDKSGDVTKKEKGEWYFDWILGGRGIQDVLFRLNSPRDQYGTTLRCYDPLIDAWHITWMRPNSGEFSNLIARRIGDRIVQEGLAIDYLHRDRWSFVDITPNSFRWLGEFSTDRGATWQLEEEINCVRKS